MPAAVMAATLTSGPPEARSTAGPQNATAFPAYLRKPSPTVSRPSAVLRKAVGFGLLSLLSIAFLLGGRLRVCTDKL